MVRFRARLVLIAGLAVAGPAMATECGPEAIGTSRTIEVDPAAFPRVGDMQYRQTLPLAEKEVVLTFDDGPWPPMTTRVLDILRSHCVKATFFLIGRNVKAFPTVALRTALEGHTVAAHSQTHPYFQRLSFGHGVREIEDSFRTIAAAIEPAGVKPAPFFRFPGLISTNTFENYLRTQGIASIATDLLASDWFRRLQKHPDQIFDRAIARLEARGSGILLLHDVKIPTVLMLPDLLKWLKENGYKIVHMVPAAGAGVKFEPAPAVAEKEKAAPAKQAALKEDASAKPAAKKPTRRKRAARKRTAVTAVKPPAADSSLGSRLRGYFRSQARSAEKNGAP